MPTLPTPEPDYSADPWLAAEIGEMLAQAGPAITATGDRSAVVQHNSGIVQTGDSSRAWQVRG